MPELVRVEEAAEEGVKPAGSEVNIGAKVAGLIGFAAGLGALLAGGSVFSTPFTEPRELISIHRIHFAVFGYLRLPPYLAAIFPVSFLGEDIALERGLKVTFYIVAALAFSESLFLYFNFKFPASITAPSLFSEVEHDSEGQPSGMTKFKLVLKDLGLGFVVAKREPEAALAYLAGFSTRSGSLVCFYCTPPHAGSFS